MTPIDVTSKRHRNYGTIRRGKDDIRNMARLFFVSCLFSIHIKITGSRKDRFKNVSFIRKINVMFIFTEDIAVIKISEKRPK